MWVVADAQGLRYHTDADGSVVILADDSVDPAEIAGAELPPGIVPRQADDGLISGEVPPAGGIGLLVLLRGASPEAVSSELLARGCSAVTLATVESGEWRIWIQDAPAAVNAAFAPSLAPVTPFFVRCAPSAPPPGSGVMGTVTLGPICPCSARMTPVPISPTAQRCRFSTRTTSRSCG